MRSKAKVRSCMNAANDALKKINSAISSENDSRKGLSSALSDVGDAYGGQAGRDLYNNIQQKISNSYSISEGLKNVKNTVNSALYEYEDEYDKLKKE